jgi:hypothetical protein
MNALKLVFRELTGLFVDDGARALEIVAVVILATISHTAIPNKPLAAGGILLFGCLGALLFNVWCSCAAKSRTS